MDEDGDQPVPLELWQRNIAMLRKEAELKEDEQPLEMLSRIAASTGIAIQFDGDLPSNADVQKLFVQAAAEALTNAVSQMVVEQKNMRDDLTEMKDDVKQIKEKPGKRWDMAAEKVLTLVIAAVVAWMLTRVGIG